MSSVFIPTGFAQLAFHFSGSIIGRDMVATLGVSVPTGWAPTAAELEDICDAMAAANRPLQKLGSLTKLVKLKCYVGNSTTAPAVFERADGRAGTGVGSQFPPALCWRITKSTALPGRRGRGRMFLPGMPESTVDDAGVVLNSEVLAMNVYLTSMVTDLAAIGGSGGLIPHLLHSDVGTTPTLITSLTCAGTVGMQQRRMGR